MYRILITISLLLFLGLNKANACTCRSMLFEEKIDKSHFIFVGEVLSVEEIFSKTKLKWPDKYKVTLKVEKSFKGNGTDTLFINSYLHSCSYHFEKGRKYLVFAHHLIENDTEITNEFLSNNDLISTSICSGTREIEDSKEYISLLNKYYDSNYSPKQDSPEKLYKKIWKNEIFIAFDEDPEFPGGGDSLNLFVKKHLQPCTLPPKEVENFEENDIILDSLFFNPEYQPSLVIINFKVSKDGHLSNFRVSKNFSLNQECNDEALRVAKLMPRWSSAKIKNIPVNASYLIAIDFKTKNAF